MFIRILCFWAVFILCTPAIAGEPLIFRSKTKDARETSVLKYLESMRALESDLPYKIAAVDLNGDGVDEWIVRQDFEGCASAADCDFAIAGLSEREPVLLGMLNARKIGIADEKAYGVRKLLVYNLKNDDFTYSVYVWSPSDQAFRPE